MTQRDEGHDLEILKTRRKRMSVKKLLLFGDQIEIPIIKKLIDLKLKSNLNIL